MGGAISASVTENQTSDLQMSFKVKKRSSSYIDIIYCKTMLPIIKFA